MVLEGRSVANIVQHTITTLAKKDQGKVEKMRPQKDASLVYTT
jgi:hypothetical protein